MIKSYIKIAWRNLIKNKTYTAINIVGLAIGLACFILISLYVVDELSYDRHHKKADRIYRVNSDLRIGGTDLHLATSSDPMGAILKDDYPQVEDIARIYNSSGSKLIKHGNRFINESRVAHADSTLFDVFTLPAIAGDTKHALNAPNTVVITKSTALRYFGSVEAVGKYLETNDRGRTVYMVTAVIEDMPRTSHFNFDFLFSMANVRYPWGSFLSHNFHTYIVLKAGTDYREFEKNFAQVIDKYIMPQAKQLMDIESIDDFNRSGNKIQYSLTPVTDIHLHSDRHPELGVNGDVQYIWIFSFVAIFVLLLACVNFINLSTARSASRAKEVGIRKVLGTGRKSLIAQFLSESIIMVMIGLALAIILAGLSMGYFNTISGKMLTPNDLLKPGYLALLLALAIFVGALAGLYPALFLSSFRPITAFRGTMDGTFTKSRFRSSMVVFQFFTSILLVSCTIIVFQQLNYIRGKKIGFSKDQVLVIKDTNALGNRTETFLNSIANMNGVQAASFAGYLPVANSSRNDMPFSVDAIMNEHNAFNAQIWDIDYDYIPTLEMNVVTGRNFSRDYGTDSTGIIINETVAKILGHEAPIGKKLYIPQDDGEADAYTIIGVVENFHYESLRQQVGPLCMRLGNNRWAAVLRVSAPDVLSLVKDIESQWKSMAPDMPFSYYFLDEAFDSMYRAEQRAGQLALSFSIFAIVIACLGLFGLTAYMIEQRTKEVGIRKVLGASVADIVRMLSKDFIKLVLIAIVAASPIAWWAMNNWLSGFAYRIDMEWWMFTLAGTIAVAVAILTLGWQAIRAATANPVDSLRDE